MPYRSYHRRRRFGHAPRTASPVSVRTVLQKRNTKCAACGGVLKAGDTVVKLVLKKALRAPCTGCGRKLKGARRYHPACQPPDVYKAMGVDPNATASASHQHTVAPPPKPPTAEELALAAMGSLEQALVARAQARGITPELEAAFKTYQGIKARALRPGTPAEGETATSLALQRLVKLVFA